MSSQERHRGGGGQARALFSHGADLRHYWGLVNSGQPQLTGLWGDFRKQDHFDEEESSNRKALQCLSVTSTPAVTVFL